MVKLKSLASGSTRGGSLDSHENLLPPTGKCLIVIGGKACQSRPLPRQPESEKQLDFSYSHTQKQERVEEESCSHHRLNIKLTQEDF
ncbi:unnamed protein product [Leuciscus chuanchicus]